MPKSERSSAPRSAGERSGGVQYWALFDHRNGEFVGCGGLRPWLYTPGEANFEVGFHLVKRCWGKGFATEAAFGALEYAWEKFGSRKSTPGITPTIVQSTAPETEHFHIAMTRNSS